LELKYTKMLACALEYKAPSKDHENYKQFMITQIRESIEWDCKNNTKLEDVKLQTAQQYIDSKIESARKDIVYHARNILCMVKKTYNQITVK